MIIFGGMPGAGKKKYTRLLSESLASQAFYEADNTNPVLQKFYRNPIRHGLASQVYFAANRLGVLREAAAYPRNVVDRSIYEDLLFAQVNYELKHLSEEEKIVYDTLMKQLVASFEHDILRDQPVLFVYLKADFQTIVKNMNVQFETEQQRTEIVEYYRALHLRYEKWMRKYYNESRFLMIDVEKYDLNKKEDRDETLRLIHTHIDALGI